MVLLLYHDGMLSQILYTKMTELQMNNRKFAQYLGICTADLSRILNSKRGPSMTVAKAIYRKFPDLADVLLKQE